MKKNFIKTLETFADNLDPELTAVGIVTSSIKFEVMHIPGMRLYVLLKGQNLRRVYIWVAFDVARSSNKPYSFSFSVNRLVREIVIDMTTEMAERDH